MAVSGENILHVNRHSYFCLRVVPLQGRYPHNFGDPPASLDPNGEVKGVTTHNLNQSIGQFVRMAGTHKTLYIGKYHNGCCSDWCSAKQRNCTMPYYQARGMPKPEPKYGLGFDRFMPMPDMDYNAPGFNNITAVPGRIDEGYGEYINVTEYQTSFIGNESIRWMKEQMDAGHPFFAMIAPHAPHVPSTPAPWYKGHFANYTAPRPPSYNYSAKDHHWLVRQQGIITDQQENSIDALFRSRWEALMSVDDLVEGVVAAVEEAGQSDRTFFMYTSDHGYQVLPLFLRIVLSAV